MSGKDAVDNPCLSSEQAVKIKQLRKERTARSNAKKRKQRTVIEDHIARRQDRDLMGDLL